VPELITTSQAVQAFRMHPITVLRLIQTRRVTAKKDANGRWLIQRSDLEAWNRQRSRKGPQLTPSMAVGRTATLRGAELTPESAMSKMNSKLAEFGSPAQGTEEQVETIVKKALGVRGSNPFSSYFDEPLKPNVPLREQIPAAGPARVETSLAEPKTEDPLKTKYPDTHTYDFPDPDNPSKTVKVKARQMVRANGAGIVDAIGNDAKTMKAIHDLTRVDLRQALINAGEDMGQATISNSRYAGTAAVGREGAFNTLLAKGYGPKEIVKLAKTPFLKP
jgi:hypothetical protein